VGEGALRRKITVEIWKSGKSTLKCGGRRSCEEKNYC
jgi:hypothetical protein